MTRADIIKEIERLDIEHARVRRALIRSLRKLNTTAGRVEQLLMLANKPMKRSEIIGALSDSDTEPAVQQTLCRLVTSGAVVKRGRGIYHAVPK